ncbi:alpha/beta fold hydrolase [Roseiarcus sp.]|uniref:alpha/beta fold hydrolase n=1 Tax=Roseiarcus sp. TaxID=1969460 RepID=UPI003F9BAFFC
MKSIQSPYGAVAVHESAGRGPAVVLIHGNSSSSRAFARQHEGPLGERLRLIAVDLPGHGASSDAEDPKVYSLPGYVRVIRAVLDALGVNGPRFVGWSMGGHILLEMAPDLPEARGFLIFGTPPVALPPIGGEFFANPDPDAVYAEHLERDRAAAFVASLFAPGFGDIPSFFVDDVLRTDGRARKFLGASLMSGLYRDEVAVVRDLKAPLAVLHGTEEQRINGAYVVSLAMPTLWRDAIQKIPGAGHAPQWETPETFDALLKAFVEETE